MLYIIGGVIICLLVLVNLAYYKERIKVTRALKKLQREHDLDKK